LAMAARAGPAWAGVWPGRPRAAPYAGPRRTGSARPGRGVGPSPTGDDRKGPARPGRGGREGVERPLARPRRTPAHGSAPHAALHRVQLAMAARAGPAWAGGVVRAAARRAARRAAPHGFGPARAGGGERQSRAAPHGFGPARAGGWPGNRALRRTGSARPGRSVARVQLAMTARVRSGLGGGGGPGGRAPGRATRRRTVPRRSQAVAAMAAAPHRVHLAPAQIVSRELFRVQHVCAYPIKRKFNLISNTAVTVSK
jgi:hypothetical protein